MPLFYFDVEDKMTPEPFSPGYRLIDGTDLNDRIANPVWSSSAALQAMPGGDLVTSTKIVDAITNITTASVANAGVTLPQALEGKVLLLNNSTNNDVVVFADGNSSINGIPGDVGDVLPAGVAVLLVATANFTWISTNFNAGGSAGNASNVNTVADFEASSFAAVIESVNILGYYSIGVGALQVRRVASEPTHPWKFRSTDRYLPNGSTDNTNGGWWEGYATTGYVMPEQFGAVRDGATDDYPAISAMISYIDYEKSFNAPPNSAISGQFLPGTYYCSQQLNSYVGARYFASGVQLEQQPLCVIKFPAGVSGWRVHNYPTGGGGACRFENIWLQSEIGQTPSAVHGWQIEKISYFEGCGALYFPGNGFNINGASDGSGFSGIVGFADFSRFNGCTASYNGYNGFYIYGADGNVCMFSNNSAVENMQFGFRSEGFLGNVFIENHTAGNGNIFGVESPYVSYSGSHYSVVPQYEDFELTLPATTTPGTNPAVWAKVAGHAVPPQHGWVNGTNYQAGGGYCIKDGSSGYGNYSESNQPPNYIASRVWLASADANGYFWGVQGAFTTSQSNCSGGAEFELPANPDYSTQEDVSVSLATKEGASENKWAMQISGSVSGDWSFVLEQEDGASFLNKQIWAATNYVSYRLIGPNSQFIHGADAAAVKGIFSVPKLGLGLYGLGDPTAGIAIEAEATAWASGTVGRGWYRFNTIPETDGRPIAWVATTGGAIGSGAVVKPIYRCGAPVFGASTFANLPSAVDFGAGARAFVTDSTQTLSAGLGLAVAGGGSNKVPVYSDGTSWLIG